MSQMRREIFDAVYKIVHKEKISKQAPASRGLPIWCGIAPTHLPILYRI